MKANGAQVMVNTTKCDKCAATQLTCLRFAWRWCYAITFLLTLSAQGAQATTWYVDGSAGNNSNAGTSASTAFLDIWRGIQVAQPGDTIKVLPTVVYPGIHMDQSGAPGAPIILQGTGVYPNLTQISSATAFGIQIAPGTSYVQIRDFNVTTGNNSTYAGIYADKNTSHITIGDNIVQNCGGDGIISNQADYIIIIHNIVYGNANNTTLHHNSGISVLASWNSDGNTGVKMVVDGNTVYGNTNVPSTSGGPVDSDGSGIILDDNKHLQAKDQTPNAAPYTGQILVENNVTFGNGGRGIHVYQTDNSVIENNTSYDNNLDPYEGNYDPGEIEVNTSGGSWIYNNIVYSNGLHDALDGGTHRGITVDECVDGDPVTVDSNLVWNPQANSAMSYYTGSNINEVTIGRHNLFGNPWFVAAGTDPSIVDFELQSNSPALGTGDSAMASTQSITGAVRSLPNGPVDMGAYQQTP
jgi:parallel beta-helix repeat protein